MVQKKLNVKLLAWTFAILVIMGVSVHVLHGVQVEYHARALCAQSDQAEKQGRLDQAVLYLGRALTLSPDDTSTLIRYSLTLDQWASHAPESRRALSVLENALARQPNRQDVRRRVALRAMDLGLYPKARTHLEELLRASPGNGELESLLGQCLEAAGEYDRAVSWYERGIKHAPAQVGPYVQLAELLRHRLDEPKKATNVMDALVEANPRSSPAYLARARYRLNYGTPELAAQDMDRAAQLAPKEADVLQAKASLAQLRGRLDEARRTWQRGLEAHPEDRRMVLGLAGLEIQAGQPETAAACLGAALKKQPGDSELIHTLADLLLHQGKDKEAAKVIARLDPNNSPACLAAYLQGRLLLKKGKWVEGAHVLEGVVRDLDAPTSLVSRASLYLARCYERTGDEDLRLIASANAVALDPASLFGRLQLGKALLDVGRVEEANQQFRSITKQPAAPAAAWVWLARGLWQRNLRKPPAQRDWQEIERTLDRTGSSATEAVPVAMLRADICLARNQTDRAQALLDKAIEKQPNQVPLWVARANLAVRRGDPQAGADTLNEARHRLGDRFELRLAQAEFWAQRGGREALQRLRELEKKLDRFNREERAQLLARLALMHHRFGDVHQAERLARQAARLDPMDLRNRLLLFDVALSTGQDKTIQEAVNEVRQQEGEDGTWWRYGEAARLLERARRGDKAARDRIRVLLHELTDRRPTWARVPLLRAYLAEVEGDSARSIEGYLKALELGERRPGILARVVQLLVERGRYALADQTIQKYQEHALLGVDLAPLATHVALKAGEPERALELARLVVSSRSRDYRDHVWLGEVYAAAGRPTEAKDAFRRAVELGDRIADPWVALVAYLGRTGQVEEAERILDGLPARLSPSQLPLVLARCHEALGRMSAAAAQYQAALARKPNDFSVLRGAAAYYLHIDEPRRAEPILRKLLEPTVVVPPEIRAWARRHLALVLAGSGADADYRLALALLDRNRSGESVADRRARALVEATRPDQRRPALRTLEALTGGEPLTPDEQFHLIRIYEAAGDWSRAQTQMQNLLEKDPLNPASLARAIRSLVGRGLKDQARELFSRLEKLEPDSARTRELKAKVHEQPKKQ
jgi:tetratricopeptide (TPR) repeat protein